MEATVLWGKVYRNEQDIKWNIEFEKLKLRFCLIEHT